VKGSEVTLKIRRPGELGATREVVLTRHVEDETMCREFQQNLSGVAGCWLEKASPSGGKGAPDQGHSQMSYEDLVRLEFEFDKKVNPIHLDPNHSHFIFIDEGKKGSGIDRAFRAVFEACISDAPNFRYPIYQLQSLRSQKKPESALVCIRRDAEIERYNGRAEEIPGDFAETKSALDCIRRDAEIEIYDSCRVLKVEMAGARSALQALFMREEGWGVDDLSDMTKKNTKEPTYWCEGVNRGVVCSALQAIWLHAGIGSHETRSKGRLAFAEAMNIKAVDERIKALRKALQDQIEAKHSLAVERGRTHDVRLCLPRVTGNAGRRVSKTELVEIPCAYLRRDVKFWGTADGLALQKYLDLVDWHSLDELPAERKYARNIGSCVQVCAAARAQEPVVE
jgi:hypothetical protein